MINLEDYKKVTTEEIRVYMFENRVRNKEMAEAMGTTQNHLSSILWGKYNLTERMKFEAYRVMTNGLPNNTPKD